MEWFIPPVYDDFGDGLFCFTHINVYVVTICYYTLGYVGRKSWHIYGTYFTDDLSKYMGS